MTMMKKFLGAAALCLAALATHAADEAPKTFRYAFRVAETGFDPVKLSDIYSRTVTAHIFEGLYTYDYLARPAKIVPLIADGEPEISEDFRVFTIKLKRGIYFADDPAFKGKKREVTAQDFVYSIKRFADPANLSQGWTSYEEAGLVGLTELRQKSIKSKKPFEYDSEIEGLRALDRYTLQIKTREPRPRLIELIIAGNDLSGALAREVVEFYGDKIAEHPVGTGPFVLKSWRRSSRMVFERNPSYRERFYDGHPAPDDAEGQALLAKFKGRRLPLVDRVEVVIMEEDQPRWLSFSNDEQDFIERVPEAFISIAMPGNKLAPNLAKRGVTAIQTVAPDVLLTIFNMDDPVVGGITPEKVALRRAIGLGLDVPRELNQVRRRQAIVAQSALVPHTTGYVPEFKSEMGDYDPARAKALLEMYGYVDRDGDGWREQPDGSPLLIVRNTQSDAVSRAIDEVWEKSMRALGIKMQFKVAQWPENLKFAQAAKFMIWDVGSTASQLDGIGALQRLYGGAVGTQNLSRFHNAEFDRIYDKMQGLPDGPERMALFQEAKRISIAYAPYKNRGHRLLTDLQQPWMSGYRRPLFWLDFWQYVDVDSARQPAK